MLIFFHHSTVFQTQTVLSVVDSQVSSTLKQSTVKNVSKIVSNKSVQLQHSNIKSEAKEIKTTTQKNI